VATGYARGEERLERELKGTRVRRRREREREREHQNEARDAGRKRWMEDAKIKGVLYNKQHLFDVLTAAARSTFN